MNQLPFVLLLVLASASASEFLRPFRQFKQVRRPPTANFPGLSASVFSLFPFGQDFAKEENLEDLTEPNDSDPENRSGFSLPRVVSDTRAIDGWSSPFDLRSSDLAGFAVPEDFKVKRTDASLSIVNALDVLRQQIILELARRKMNESKAQIQRNRELLMKTGKRSVRNYDYLSDCGTRNLLAGNRKEGDDSEREISGAFVKGGDENSTTRSHSEIPYQA